MLGRNFARDSPSSRSGCTRVGAIYGEMARFVFSMPHPSVRFSLTKRQIYVRKGVEIVGLKNKRKMDFQLVNNQF